MDNLEKFKQSYALEHVLEWEKPKSNNAEDLGGNTVFGFAQNFNKDIDVDTLDLEKAIIRYKANYYDLVRGDELPEGLALCMFDFAVTSGPDDSIKALQRALLGMGYVISKSGSGGDDGIFGGKTMDAVKDIEAKGVKKVIELLEWFTAFRTVHYGEAKTKETFVTGWQRRAANALVKATMISLVNM